jgi:anti-sigma regulatory factor (Ser/Thr protein kinase)/serine/threonine protein phosphatase PrpC
MEIIRNQILSLPIDDESDVGTCRRKGTSLAMQMGFNEVKSGEIAIVISELVTNVLQHGGGKGRIVIYQIEDQEKQKAIEIWCCDAGDGIANIQQSLQDGFTEKNSLGIGMGTIRRFSDEMEINPEISPLLKESLYSDAHNYGHCIRILKRLPGKKWIGMNRKLTVGAASRCHAGETLNGDAFLVIHLSATLTVAAVIDGLGHGKEANLASELIKENILLNPDLPPDNLISHIHNSVRGTRGAVMSVARINTETNKLSFSGIGNIESFVVTNKKKKTLLSFGGIVGHNIRTPKIFEYDFEPGDVLCMFSDGITTRWKSEDIDWGAPPQKNTELIINEYSRINDDATILIICYTQ